MYRTGRVLLGVVWGAAAVFAGATDSRSLTLMAPVGLIILLNGWGMLTNWGGIWQRAADQERRRYEATEQLPLGRTRAGRFIREFKRNDDPASRGLQGAVAIIFGPAFIVLGLLAAVGIFRPVT